MLDHSTLYYTFSLSNCFHAIGSPTSEPIPSSLSGSVVHTWLSCAKCGSSPRTEGTDSDSQPTSFAKAASQQRSLFRHVIVRFETFSCHLRFPEFHKQEGFQKQICKPITPALRPLEPWRPFPIICRNGFLKLVDMRWRICTGSVCIGKRLWST